MDAFQLRRQANECGMAGKHREAARLYERALELSPNDAHLAFRLAEVRRRAGDLQGALRAYERAADLFRLVGLDSKALAAERVIAVMAQRAAQTTPRQPLWRRLFGHA